MHEFNKRRNYRRHAFEAIQVETNGRESLLATFTVATPCHENAAYAAAEHLCEKARKLAHGPAAFVREINRD